MTYCILCSRQSVRANDFRACARTSRMIRVQLSTLESAMVGPKVTPNMSTRSLSGMSSGGVGLKGDMSLKNQVTPPEIDPRTARLVAQLLNHYATPGPTPKISGQHNGKLLVGAIWVSPH